jgi:hypothetical protein
MHNWMLFFMDSYDHIPFVASIFACYVVSPSCLFVLGMIMLSYEIYL